MEITVQRLEAARKVLFAEAHQLLYDSNLMMQRRPLDDDLRARADVMRQAGKRMAEITGYIEALRDFQAANPLLAAGIVAGLVRDLQTMLRDEASRLETSPPMQAFLKGVLLVIERAFV